MIIFRKNPTFTQVIPERSTESGGIIVDVTGSGFKLLQRPHMVVVDEGRTMKGPRCDVVHDDLMFCKTPNLEIPHNRFFLHVQFKNYSFLFSFFSQNTRILRLMAFIWCMQGLYGGGRKGPRSSVFKLASSPQSVLNVMLEGMF